MQQPDSSAKHEELDARLDGELTRRFGPPHAEAIAAGALPPVPSLLAPWQAATLAVGAVVFALTLALTLALGGPENSSADTGGTSDADARVEAWVSTYEEVDAGGDHPTCSCTPACASFAEHCHAAFARALHISADAVIELCGDSCRDASGEGVSLVARCDGETVCLFVLLKEAAPKLHETLRDGLQLHRRDIGILSAFELSPLKEPAILPHLVSN